jgi:amino acid permease
VQPGVNKHDEDSSNPYRTTREALEAKGQVVGPSSNFMTFVKYMRHLIGISFFLVPIGLKDIGIQSFGVAIIYTVLIYIFTIWMQLRTERRLGEYARGIEDLLTLVFGDSVITLYHIIRIMSCLMFIVVFIMYLGTETDVILCQTVRGFSCGKFENHIRLGYMMIVLPIVLTGRLQASKIVSIVGFLSFLIAFGMIIFHEVLMFEDKSHS